MKFSDLPAIKSPLPGGLYAGITFNPEDHMPYAVVLAEAKPNEHLNFKDAQAWAKSLRVDGFSDFKVPNRLESLLLFHTLPDRFEQAWHWTSTQYSVERGAWVQGFYYGNQNSYDKSYEGRVRAVRLIHLTT